VVFEGEVVKNNESNRGMVIDFGEIKCILRALVVDPLDHAFMVKDDDPFAAHLAQFAKHIGGPIKIKEVPFDPTAEKIAEFIFQRVNKAIGRVKVVEVTVWETPSCKAVYRP
jgi:6-pyruvoyltetrahydropterin/6-carboxytetrahydropterin synthase